MENKEVMPQPLGESITSTLRWAMDNEVTLYEAPFENNFCGSQFSCLYAGMTDVDKLFEEQSLRRFAATFVFSLYREIRSEDKPKALVAPPNDFFVATVNTMDESNPRVCLYLYDSARTLKSRKPYLSFVDLKDIEHKSKMKRTSFYGMRQLAVEGFCLELKNLVTEYLSKKTEEREEAVQEIAGESHVNIESF